MDYTALKLALQSIPAVNTFLFVAPVVEYGVEPFRSKPPIDEIIAQKPRYCAVRVNGDKAGENVMMVFAHTLDQVERFCGARPSVDVIDLHDYLGYTHRLTYRIFGALDVRYEDRSWRQVHDFVSIPDWYHDAERLKKEAEENRLWTRLSRIGSDMVTALWQKTFGSVPFYFWPNGIALGADPQRQRVIHSEREWGIRITVIDGAVAVGNSWYPKMPQMTRGDMNRFVEEATRITGVPITYAVTEDVLLANTFAVTHDDRQRCHDCHNSVMCLKAPVIDKECWNGLRQKGVCAVCGKADFQDTGRNVNWWRRATVAEIGATKRAVERMCAHYQRQLEALASQNEALAFRRKALGV